MARICPHCWHSLETALRTDPTLHLCPDCGGAIGNAMRVEFVAQGQPPEPATDAARPAATEAAATHAVGDEAAPGPATADTEAALEAIDHAAEAVAGTGAPLPELEARPGTVDPLAEAETLVETPAATEPAAPSFTRADPTPARVRSGRWQWAALAALGLLLGLQILLADRERLAADPNWRPLLGALCGALRCELPPWREPRAFAMLSRDVRPVPGSPGTLLVQATFRNDARWPQPWPALQLSLSDADGRTIGARVFAADEYLDGPAAQAGLSPGQSAQVSLRLHEPETPAVAFSFDFR